MTRLRQHSRTACWLRATRPAFWPRRWPRFTVVCRLSTWRRACAPELYPLPGRQSLIAAYPEFVWLMQRSKLIVSDSGGIQEEAPSLQRPVVALREATERSEAVDAGAVVCVGSSAEAIRKTVRQLLTEADAYRAMQIDRSP